MASKSQEIAKGASENEEGSDPRKRSPSYPAVGLETCVKWIRKIYEAERRSTTSTAVISKVMGYSPKSGSARVGISSLKKFGLLAIEGAEKVRVSDDAVKYLLHPDDSGKRALLRRFAFKPALFQELLVEHPSGLPSDETLRYKLEGERDFLPEAANTVIRALRETVRFAELDSGEALEDTNGENGTDLAPPSSSEDERGSVDEHHVRVQLPTPPAVGSTFRFELSDGTSVHIQATQRLTASAVEEVREHLELYERRLKKRESGTEQA